MRTKGLFHRERKPGAAELKRMRRVEEAWRAERKHADEEWSRELDRRRADASSGAEPTDSEPSAWAATELLRQREEASKGR